MRKLLFLALGLFMILPTQAQTERPLFYVHYMPWYQAPSFSGYWGWHWTMNHFQPDTVDENGRPNIASHYIPLTGAYDSQDPAILEYQVLLMKMSGIDGVIADWYGTENFRDYAIINQATLALFEYTQKAGLGFALCYEDRTADIMLSENHISAEDIMAHGAEVMNYAGENYMSHESYLRFNEQPLLFTFGPLYYRNPVDWETMFTGISPSPALITLDNRMATAALGSYPWPPMSLSGGLELAPAVLESYMEQFNRAARRNDYIVGGAFPQFHDIYEEAGVRSSYGYLDPQGGETFRMTFDKSLEANPNLIQLITWNDYGEGTMIEPTEETGYQYLEIVQEERLALDTGFSYTSEDLTLALQLYNLRKANAGNAEVNAQLDAAFDAIIAADMAAARSIIEALSQ